jgi:hypothetical protein
MYVPKSRLYSNAMLLAPLSPPSLPHSICNVVALPCSSPLFHSITSCNKNCMSCLPVDFVGNALVKYQTILRKKKSNKSRKKDFTLLLVKLSPKKVFLLPFLIFTVKEKHQGMVSTFKQHIKIVYTALNCTVNEAQLHILL